MSKLTYSFRGLMAPVFTPFNNDSARTLNLSIIPQYANMLSKNGINGILVNGTTGEGTSMSVAERKLVAEAWAKAVKSKKQHLMVEVGGAPLPDVLELARHAESLNVDSILCRPELYFKPSTPNELIKYLKLVSDAAPKTPLLYYHIPKFTNVNIHMGQFLESVGDKIPTFVGIKFTSTNLEEGAQAIRADNNKYVVFLGSDQIMSAACALGMDSFIATSLNMLPQTAQQILDAAKAGDLVAAKNAQADLSDVVTAISKHGHWVQTMKYAMKLITRFDVGPPRAPLEPLSIESMNAIDTLAARDLK